MYIQFGNTYYSKSHSFFSTTGNTLDNAVLRLSRGLWAWLFSVALHTASHDARKATETPSGAGLSSDRLTRSPDRLTLEEDPEMTLCVSLRQPTWLGFFEFFFNDVSEAISTFCFILVEAETRCTAVGFLGLDRTQGGRVRFSWR